jgi:hypothetical protein
MWVASLSLSGLCARAKLFVVYRLGDSVEQQALLFDAIAITSPWPGSVSRRTSGRASAA